MQELEELEYELQEGNLGNFQLLQCPGLGLEFEALVSSSFAVCS